MEPTSEPAPIKFKFHTHEVDGGTVWEIRAEIGADLPTVSDDFGLALGDCLHNYRSALDHLAWRLVPHVTKSRLSPEERRGIYFPMAKTRAKYWGGHADNRLPGVSRDFLTLFERYQPYRRTNRGRAIRFLRELTNIDKHRAIIVTPTYMGIGSFDLEWEGGTHIASRQLAKAGQQIKRGTPIALIALASPPSMRPRVEVRGTFEYGLAFPSTILRRWPGGIPVSATDTIAGIGRTCEEILSEVDALL